MGSNGHLKELLLNCLKSLKHMNTKFHYTQEKYGNHICNLKKV